MRLTTILLIASLMQVYAIGAAQTITIHQRQASLESVLKEIRKQSGYDFYYDGRILPKKHKVDVSVNKVTLSKALDAVLSGLELTYTVEGNIIAIKKQEALFAGSPIAAFQAPVVTGTVKDRDGKPLSGVTVSASNASAGFSRSMSTTAEGTFSFNNLPAGGPYTFTFSYIGFQTQTKSGYSLAQGTKLSIPVVMEDASAQLSDVVIVGYGQQRKQELTSAVSSFKPTEQNARPVLGPDQLIQGRMPGVNVSSGSGSPGSVSRVTIRGIGSLSATNEPLYVIDGVPIVNQNAALINMGENMSPLALLNPNDIESVEVLKDAASAAIYGSRATNGVILITTKTGQAGKSRFSVDLYTGVSTVPNTNKMKMAGPEEYLSVVNEGIDAYNTQNNYQPGSTNYMLRKENPFPGEPGTDWFDLITRTAQTQSASFSFTGGTDKTKIYLSGNYLGQEGAIISQKFTKYTAKLNLSHKLYDWLEFGVNTNYSYATNNRVPGSNLGSTMMARSIPQRPFDRPFKPDGSYYLGGTDELIYHNPIQIVNEQNVELDNYRLLGTFMATARIT